MNAPRVITEADLHAYIDDALPAERRKEVEAALAADPAMAERAAAFRGDMDMLKRAYPDMRDAPLPPEWIAQIRRSRRSSVRKYVAVCAAAVIAVLVAFAYWFPRQSAATGVVETALRARSSIIVADTSVSATTGTGPDHYNGLLRSALSEDVKVPDMSRLGFHLDGLRIYAGARPADRAVELIYRDRAGRVFTLYLRRSDGQVHFDQFARDGLRVCFWQDEMLTAVMAGDVSTAAMQRLASLAYAGMTS